jgi:hypothetical protein
MIRKVAIVGLVFAGSFAFSTPGHAQLMHGVGYNPQARGFAVSSYQLDSLSAPFRTHLMDFSARPDLVGAVPNAYYMNFGDPAVRAAYEQRYGPDTSGPRMKRWVGPNNEVRSIVADALAWAYAQRHEFLGGSPAGFDGHPTEVEITDAQAVNDRDLYITFLIATVPGFSPETRVEVCDASLPGGDSQSENTFWSLTYYVHNNYQPPPPVSPQIPGGGCTP